jgi:hypothetical protein
MSTRSAQIKELGRAGEAGEYAEARRDWHKSKVSRKNFGPATLALR